MDHDISYEVEDEAQFWQEVDDIIQPTSTTPSAIQNVVNNFISFVSQFGADYLTTDADVEICCEKLLDSDFHMDNAELVREAMIAYQPEQDKIAKCYVNLYLLLLDGRKNTRTFKLMKRAHMVPVIANWAKQHQVDSIRFTRLALTTLYEMCRMQKLSEADMHCFDEEFIWFLLRSVEISRDDDDPYSYNCIKVIVSLNEQFMVAGLPQAQQPFPRTSSNTSLSVASIETTGPHQAQNSIVKVLSDHGSRFKAFGENLIRMLNRERDTALQLLILKQLFLLFTNAATYEYFYTNDLHVLIDVFIRELYNLPTEDEALRHTYLRVLHPLLIHTQLRHAPFYKATEMVNLLTSLNQECSHFGPVGTTTVRLLARCLTVPWLLPPRKRKLKIPRPGFTAERKKSAKNLGMSLDQSETASIASFHSVNSIAKVRPPTTPRIKPPVKDKGNASARLEQSHLAPVTEGVTTASNGGQGKSAMVDSVELSAQATEKHDDLMREIGKLEISA
ncbi:Putative uncharacterized protein [Taphrina deformans PYCC 5710]|uniref:SPIN90/Ldb17 leucine-rich domain-containing protein n=1 Tax=Taphrina deformans (strain PYCC 5710 / ATCC 11124 / CBS 356.35 / IMI 108563 / JCM 9778 / NBRC 8474) TaxID=1097556 RepID=R4XDR0_TAPDE|nr:Putative uncharacterized protein [Taphrina deformans PYCC 5710]|eukprot:CCG82560.1 Putative uncharacterized protein [Taphrina deformans PYCC 5710]